MLYTIFYIIFTTIFTGSEHIQLFGMNSPEESNSETSYFSAISSQFSNKEDKGKLILAIEIYANQNQCNFTLNAPKMVIQPYEFKNQNSVYQKTFSNIYLKCAACLAVANEVRC